MSTPNYHLDWLTFSGKGYTDSSGIQWILMEETGFWDSPEPRTDIVERTSSHGSYMGPSYFRHRVVTLKGRAYAPNDRVLRSAWSQVSGIGSDPQKYLSLSCDSEIGTLTCQVRRDDKVITEPVRVLNGHAFEFSLGLVAPDPRKYSAQWRTMRADLPQATTGDGLDFTQAEMFAGKQYRGLEFRNFGGLVFGSSNSTGLLQLVNSGSAPTAPIYTLYGPLTTPVLTATTGGVTSLLQYNGTLSASESLVINPSVPSVLLDGTASRRHLLNPAQFSGFYIPETAPDGTAGALRVGLRHAGPVTTGGYATATFRDAWF